METQYISLNMTPTGVNPCFHISQYDVGRMLGFIVHSGGATVDLDTYTCTIEATRSDGTAITSAVATTDNIGTFEVTPTMSNKTDKYRCQLVIVDAKLKRIASLPFDMEVTKAAMDENSESIEEDASLYQQYTEAVQGAIAEANADIQAEENARIAAVNAEATARQNADATLQNNIDAEATARQTADNTLQGNINSEASTRASADSNLQSQINQIVAPSGEAPSAAEVQNARIGADNVTHSTLGDAIRGQVTDLKNALRDNVTKNNIYLTDVIYGDKQIVSATSDAYIYTNIPFVFQKDTLYKIKLTRSEPSTRSFNISTSIGNNYIDRNIGNMLSGQDVTVVSFIASAIAYGLRIEDDDHAGITYTAEIETEVLTSRFNNLEEANEKIIRQMVDPIYRNKFQGIVANALNLFTDLPYNFVRGFYYRITVEISIDAPEDILLGIHNGSTYVHDNISVIKKGTRSTVFNFISDNNATKIVAKIIKNINFDYTYSISTEIVSDIEMCAESQMMEFALSTAKYAKGWIRYSNGELVGSEATMTYVLQRKLFPKYIKAFLTSDTDVLCAIAFYRTNDISTEGYLKDSSVDFLTGDHNNGAWYSAKVPDDCKIITITTKKPSATIPKPILLHPYINDTNGAEYIYMPCYDHLFVNYHGNDIVIPHESLYHIRISRLLGFNMIELNVTKTIDNVYVVNHFIRGNFGDYFEHIDGETDISEIAVSSVTWEWIAENVRYKSQIGKYRTRPERLEEALAECKKQGLTPFIQAEESGVIEIADQYMGEGNYVAYNATRLLCPKAPIFRGENFTDKNEILNYCNEYGRPFIYSLLNVDDFTESELRDIVKTLHDNGYKIATSYNDTKWSKLREIGFDLNGTQLLINRINNGNLYNYESIFSFGNFTYTNATENNGELIFSDDGKIEPNIQDATYELCGIDVEVSFSGKIYVENIGEFWGAEYINDAVSSIYVSTPIINGSPKVTIRCYSGTIIKDIKYKASIL